MNLPMNKNPMNNKPMNNKPMKMKLMILLCFAALPAMSVRAADRPAPPAEERSGVGEISSDRDPFWDDKSPECQFLAGAWEGYVAGLTASADRDSDYQATLVRSFHRMQRGVNANARAYENTKQKCSDTDEHKALFLQVEKVARLVDKAFVKRFSKPTNLANYERWLGMDWGDNAENLAAKRGSAEAIASSHVHAPPVPSSEGVIPPNRRAETIPLPKLDGRSAKGLELECSLVQATFAVGEPVNIWCTVKNTTDSIKPVGWHPFGGVHFCQVQKDKSAWEGLMPTVVPHLDTPIMITSKDVPGYVLFVPAHESLRILLTHKEDRPGKFKGRVVYDPLAPRGGWVGTTKDGPPWKDEWLSSNEFEYEVVAPTGK